jgi:hypothetical protein
VGTDGTTSVVTATIGHATQLRRYRLFSRDQA